MGQNANYVAEEDVQTLLRKEMCALGTGQISNDQFVVVKDAQTKFLEVGCA